MGHHKDLEIALIAAVEAGDRIMEVYNSNEEINYEKKIDHSPLTIADKKSHETIVNHLQKTDIKIISEESKTISFDERRNWDIYWLVDPLDGTKEFIKKNGEFTVNIALISNGEPILGVVYAPVLDIAWYGIINEGSYKVFNNESAVKINVIKPDNDKPVQLINNRDSGKFVFLYI